MSLIFRVITAAHAKGTHHRLVLDGIARLHGPQGELWQRLFLAHAAELVKGSKAPDDEFKDFKNHVLHPRDGYWGGAVGAAQKWYAHLVEALAKADWPEAASCAGILSHYVTDPVNPFHTAQSEAESSIHRAFEWSISRSYDDLKRIAAADAERTINIPDGADWLEQLLRSAATDANVHYEKLIAHYDIHRGVVDPPSGLDSIAQHIVGDLIGLASALFAAVLDRAIVESKAEPPEVDLTLDVVLSTLRIPVTALLKKIADRRERALVERIYDELKATGTVEKNLPGDDRAVRDLYAFEVLGQRNAAGAELSIGGKAGRTSGPRKSEPKMNSAQPANRVTTRPLPPPTSEMSRGGPPPSAREVPIDEPARPAPRAADQAAPLGPVSRFRGEPINPVVEGVQPSQAQAPDDPAQSAGPVNGSATAERPPVSQERSALATAAAAAASIVSFSGRKPGGHGSAAHASGAPRLFLAPQQNIVDAPSIGPKMAERLVPLGLETVADLLAAKPDTTAARLDFSGVTAATIVEWQQQAKLVCTVPGLRGTHAQLLVGAGYLTPDAVAAADPQALSTAVLAFAAGTAGQRLLRNGDPPDVERIRSWVANARGAMAA